MGTRRADPILDVDPRQGRRSAQEGVGAKRARWARPIWVLSLWPRVEGCFIYLFIFTSLLEYSCFTMVC